jgi:tRNA A58 N-methylase Trm61
MDNFDLKKYLVENKVTTQPKTVNEEIQKSLLDTSKYIEPKDMEDILEKIYNILSGNVRDYISIPNIEQVIKVLKQYDKTQ